LVQMAHKSAWTLEDMKGELDEVVNSWASKVPGLKDNKETEVAKKLHRAITGLSQVVGSDATVERIEGMTRTEKLKAAAASQTTVPELNQLIQQFGTTALMHKVLRHRQSAGKSLPETPEATQAILQTEGIKFMSSEQKRKVGKLSHKDMLKSGRRRR